MKKKEIKEKLLELCYFDGDLLNEVADNLKKGYGVLTKVKLYQGAGVHKLNRDYKYKMILPILDKNSNFYSTDVFGLIRDTLNSTYEIYRGSLKVIEIVKVIKEVDTSEQRFRSGYTIKK